jgi:hypothetical protein
MPGGARLTSHPQRYHRRATHEARSIRKENIALGVNSPARDREATGFRRNDQRRLRRLSEAHAAVGWRHRIIGQMLIVPPYSSVFFHKAQSTFPRSTLFVDYLLNGTLGPFHARGPEAILFLSRLRGRAVRLTSQDSNESGTFCFAITFPKWLNLVAAVGLEPTTYGL